jgi:methionyl-tRNA synthetase
VELSPKDLINPISKLSGKKPTLKKTSHYYFNLPKFKSFLEGFLEDKTDWKTFTLSQAKALLATIKDRPITRDLTWGIPVPLPEMKDKVLYVWFEALIGYISFAKKANSNAWQDDSYDIYNFIGKDNIVFHTIFFPALLHAIECNKPTNVVANQFLNYKGKKFSKSKGNTIEPHKFLEEYEAHPNAADILRFTIARKLPELNDTSFSISKYEDPYESHYNKELVDNFGNLVNRVTSLIHRYNGGVVYRYHAAGVFKYPNVESPIGFYEAYNILNTHLDEYIHHMENFSPKKALSVLLLISSEANKMIQNNEPWLLHKKKPNCPHLQSILAYSINLIGVLSVLYHPFIPDSSQKLRKILNLPEIESGDLLKTIKKVKLGDEMFTIFHKLGESNILFQKI